MICRMCNYSIMQPWFDLMKTEPESIIFIYLLFLGPDYGYNISKTFQAAISDNRWHDTRGRQTLKNPNLVSATLKEMGEKGILKRIGEGRRSYYDVNIDVLRIPINSDLNHTFSIEYDGIEFEIIDGEDILTIITLLREIKVNKAKFIEYLNTITTFDYLTILGVFNEIITRFTLYLTIGMHITNIEEGKFIYDGLTANEIREKLTEIYNMYKPEISEKIIALEMKTIRENNLFRNRNRAQYLEKLIDVGFEEENIDQNIESNKIDLHEIILSTSQNFNRMISKIVYYERGIHTATQRELDILRSG